MSQVGLTRLLSSNSHKIRQEEVGIRNMKPVFFPSSLLVINNLSPNTPLPSPPPPPPPPPSPRLHNITELSETGGAAKRCRLPSQQSPKIRGISCHHAHYIHHHTHTHTKQLDQQLDVSEDSGKLQRPLFLLPLPPRHQPKLTGEL